MGIYAIKPMFRRALAPLERALIRMGVSADLLTLFGVAFAGLAGAGVWLGQRDVAWLLLVPVCAFLRTACNALDGMVATSTGQDRPLGEVLNEGADRVSDIAMFLPLLAFPGISEALVACAVAAMMAASYLGLAVKAAGGPRVYRGVMGKPDRMLVVSIAAIVALWVEPSDVFTVALWVVVAGSGITFAQRALIARAVLK